MYVRSQIRTRQAWISLALALIGAQHLKSQIYQHGVRLTTVINRNQFAIHLRTGTGPSLGTLRGVFQRYRSSSSANPFMPNVFQGRSEALSNLGGFSHVRTHALSKVAGVYFLTSTRSDRQCKTFTSPPFTFLTSSSNALRPWTERIKKLLALLDVAHLFSSNRASPSPVAWLESHWFNTETSNYRTS